MHESNQISLGLVSHAVEISAEADEAGFNPASSTGELSKVNSGLDPDTRLGRMPLTRADGSEPYRAVPPGSNHQAARECIDISVDDPLLPSDESHGSDASIDMTGGDRTSVDDGLEDAIHEKFDAATIHSPADDEDDIDPWYRIQDEIAEEPLVVNTDTNHDVLSFEPDEEPVQNDALVELIFLEIEIELDKGRQSEYDVGKLFHRLQRERAKPGSGTFTKDIEVICYECAISISTIYRRINFFKAVNGGRSELENVRLCHADKDAWPADSASDEIEAEEKDEADALAMVQRKAIEAAAHRVAEKKAENAQRHPVKTIKLAGLSRHDRKAVHSAFVELKKVMGDNEASDWVAHAIISKVEQLTACNEAAIGAEADDE